MTSFIMTATENRVSFYLANLCCNLKPCRKFLFVSPGLALY